MVKENLIDSQNWRIEYKWIFDLLLYNILKSLQESINFKLWFVAGFFYLSKEAIFAYFMF